MFLCLLSSCERKSVTLPKESILTSDYFTFTSHQKKEYLDSVSFALPKIKNDSIKIKFLFEVAAAYYYLRDSKSSYDVSKKIYMLSLKNHDSLSMGRSLYYMGDSFENYKKDSAYFFYKESEKIFRDIHNEEMIAKALFNKAHLLFKEGNYTESEIEVTKALQELQYSKNYDLLYQCYYLQSCNHTELEEYANALNYLKLAQESLRKYQKTTGSIGKWEENDVLNTIALSNIYDKKGAYKTSISLLQQLLSSKLKNEKPIFYSIVLGNLAYSNMKDGNYEISKKQYLESILLAKRLNHVQGYLFKIINFGEYYLTVRDTTAAIGYFEKALPLSKRLKMGTEVLKTLEFLARSNPQKAAFYQSAYVAVSDSLVKHQRLNSEKFSRIEYETRQVSDSNKILTTNNLLLVLSLVITFLVFLIALLIRNRATKKKELLLVEQKELANNELFSLIKKFQLGLIQAKEEEQNRISKELHDGVVNQIYAIRMVLETLNEKSDAPTKGKRMLYIKELNKVESEIRDLSHDLSIADHFIATDFNFLLESLIKSNNGFSGIDFVLTSSKNINWDAYSSVVKVNLYRILQELLLNVNKHSGAKKCSLDLLMKDGQIIIRVKDDGVGYDVLNTKSGIGLKNIKERMKLINGEFSVFSCVDLGTEFILVL